MKTFIKNLSKFALMLLPFIALPYIVCLFAIDESVAETMMGIQRVKIACLAKTVSPKMVFIGGSGCSHGINTRTIETHFKMPVVNMGLHGGMGLAYQLESIDEYIKAGDYVFIVPEYNNFSCCLGSEETLDIVCDVCPDEKRKLDITQWKHLFFYMPAYGMSKIRRIVKRKVFHSGLGKAAKNGWKYNEYGDMTNSWFDVTTKLMKPAKKNNVDTLTDDCFNRIKRFVDNHSDANVYVMPAAFQDLSFENNREYIAAIAERLAKNGTPFVAKPERYKMRGNEHSDTPYHLNGKGISIRTKRLIEDIEKLVNK